MQRLHQQTSREEAQSLVEFAISLVLLLILLAGVVDIGRAFFTFISLRDAVQEGASYGVAFPTHCTQIKERIKHTSSTPISLDSLSDDAIDVRISGVDCSTAVTLGLACTPNELRVAVEMDNFQITMPFLGAILGRQTLTLRANIVDTIISNPCSSP